MNITHPHFVVSDLHLGDKGPRDNFAWMSGGWREQEFNNFLDYVVSEDGELTIIGDLFELWQGNVSKVLTCRMPLLDRLADMGARYLLGNHDIDLMYLTGTSGLMLDHPLFADLKFSHTIEAGGRKILLIHGHEQDVYCKSEVPGIGRISAIYSGIREDKNGSPLNHRKYGGATVETRSLGRWGRFSQACRRLTGKKSASQVMLNEVYQTFVRSGCEALIYGHTHEPGQFLLANGHNDKVPVYNTGTWAETVNTFARINEDTGLVSLFNWTRDGFDCNTDELKVK